MGKILMERGGQTFESTRNLNRRQLELFDHLGTAPYSTVTDFAKFRGWSTSAPFTTATW